MTTCTKLSVRGLSCQIRWIDVTELLKCLLGTHIFGNSLHEMGILIAGLGISSWILLSSGKSNTRTVCVSRKFFTYSLSFIWTMGYVRHVRVTMDGLKLYLRFYIWCIVFDSCYNDISLLRDKTIMTGWFSSFNTSFWEKFSTYSLYFPQNWLWLLVPLLMEDSLFSWHLIMIWYVQNLILASCFNIFSLIWGLRYTIFVELAPGLFLVFQTLNLKDLAV